MKLTCDDYEQLSVLTPHGDVTADDCDALRKAAEDRIAKQVRDFVVDLSEVEFVDSRGLETLLWLQDKAGEQLGQVRLAAVQPSMQQVLRVTRLATRFDRHDTVDGAIKSLRI